MSTRSGLFAAQVASSQRAEILCCMDTEKRINALGL